MEYKRLITAFYILSILLIIPSCDYVDIPDMFVSPSSVNDRYEQSMEWNNAHPSKTINVTSEDYTLLNIADMHVGSTENLELFINKALINKPTAIVINGDFVSGHSADYNHFDNTMFPQDSIPYFLTLGNHELYFDGWNEFYTRYGSSMYYFSIKTPSAEDLYLCLDTGSGTLGEKQLKWVKQLLESKRTNYRNCIIFTHVNLFRDRHTSSTNPNTEELYVLLDLFAKHQINMVISAHDHVRYVEKLGNTTHISIDALKDGIDNAGYLMLQISPSSINYTFFDI